MNFGYDEDGNRLGSSSSESGSDEEQQSPGGGDSWGSSSTSSSLKSKGRRASTSSSDDSSEAEIIIGEEPTQDIEQPLVDPSEVVSRGRYTDPKKSYFIASGAEETPVLQIEDQKSPAEAAAAFMNSLSSLSPSRVRTAAIIGAFHHGKTSFLQMLLGKKGRSMYTPTRDEVERGISIKSRMVTLVASGATQNLSSHLVSLIDTPGHPSLMNEAAAALHLADMALMCVDATESVLDSSVAVLRRAVEVEHLPVVLVITKLDRLIIEMKLPPLDAYRKLRTIVDSVNNVLQASSSPVVSPEDGTVLFCSASLGFCFSLNTFAQKYAAVYRGLNPSAFAKQLWGQVTYDGKRFVAISNARQKQTFVEWVLEPLYKIVSHAACGGAGMKTLSPSLSATPRSPIDAIKAAVAYFCGAPEEEGFDVLLAALPDPAPRTSRLLQQYNVPPSLLGSSTGVVGVASLVRLYAEDKVAAVVRILHGTLTARTRIIVVDDCASDADPYERMTVERLFVVSSNGLTPVHHAREGQVVMMTGMGRRSGQRFIFFGGELAEREEYEEDWLKATSDFTFPEPSYIHVDVELKDTRKLEVLQAGLQILQRTTPGLQVRRQESGEFTLSGCGELQLDCALRELRQVCCPGVLIGISPPYVSFRETVQDEEGLLAMVGTKRSAVGVVCGTLPTAFLKALEKGGVGVPSSEEERMSIAYTSMLRSTYGFDELDATQVMGVGPDPSSGLNVFFDDSLLEEKQVSKALSREHREAILTGFRVAVSAGPLINEAVRGVRLNLIFADIDPSTKPSVVRANARSAARQALLGARPRLLEPVLAGEVLCPDEDCVDKVKEIITQRRGVSLHVDPIPATVFTRLHTLVPAIDAFGLETQIRFATHGQCFPLFSFSHWDRVPGDPYDSSIRVAALEPALGYQLSRDFVLKTRFRKGMSEQLLGDVAEPL